MKIRELESCHVVRAVLILLWLFLLCAGPPVRAATLLVSTNSTWTYRKGTAEASDPRSAWRELDYDDSGWSSAAAPFGYGETGVNSAVSDMKDSYTTFFLRKTFTVTSLDEETRLLVRVDYDDGFIVWVNGERVAEENAPDGSPLHDSLASQDHEHGLFEDFEERDAADYLELGTNVVAIQVFNVRIDSSDCYVDAELNTYKRVADTKFSHDRGFYNSPFTCTIRTATTGATIRYTLNGDDPRTGTGVQTISASSAAILIDPDSATDRLINGQKAGCVVLRAYAEKADYAPCNVDTHTYIFVDKVAEQQNLMSGENWAQTWQGEDPQHYMNTALDSAVIDHSSYSNKIVSSLQALPTLSIAADYAGLWGDSRGFFHYPNSTNHGVAWERACSAELIYPDGAEGFQADCGVRLQGNSSHVDPFFAKKGLRLKFKKSFGPGRLRFPFFQDAPVNADSDPEEYDTITLRGGANNSWAGWEASKYVRDGGDTERITYARDQWVRDTQILMSDSGFHGNFVHLYLNGIYWGLYNPCEDTRQGTMSVMFGGEADDWFTARRDDPDWWSGDSARWTYLHSTLSARDMTVQANYEEAQEYLDVEQFVDYILLHWYTGDGDWPSKNYGSSVLNEPPGRTRYFAWDCESTWILSDGRSYNGAWIHPAFYDSGWSKYTSYQSRLWRALDNNIDFRCTVADRTYKHCYNDGPLVESGAKARYQTLCDAVEEAVIAESARWGDYWEARYGSTWTSRMGSMPYHRDGYWYTARDKVLTDMDGNVAQFVATLRSNPYGIVLYPDVDPPTFQQHGGAIGAGFHLTMTNPNGTGTLVYRADGGDPRTFDGTGAESGGALVYSGPLPLGKTTYVTARIRKNNNTWSAAHAATFSYTAHHPLLRITEIHYNPLGGRDFEFVEIRNVSGSTTVGLSEMTFDKGIQYTFAPGTELAPSNFAVLVRNEAAFTNRYPTVKGLTEVQIFGQYGGGLDNGGERVQLVDAAGTIVASVRYNDKTPWPETADGEGFSLVYTGADDDQDYPEKWRASNLIGGSPGYDEGPAYRVVINEALTHTDLPLLDAIELYNDGDADVDVGGWWLSDSDNDFFKYELPTHLLGAGGYQTYDENDFGAAFLLSSHGDEVYLTKWDTNSNLLYYAEARFGGAENARAFGRYVKSDGNSDFVAQSVSNTLGAVNADPLVGPVVITEIMYHPPDNGDEFIELMNVSEDPVNLYDPAHPTNTWRLDGAVEYAFPTGLTLQAGEILLVAATNNATGFRNKYSVPAEVQIFCPYGGVLNNAGESVKLWRPDTPDTNGLPWILVDRVKYNDNSPWPESPDGDGPSLERIAPGLYGNDPINWSASAQSNGTPGTANAGVLVSKRAGWKYHDRGQDLGTGWRAPSYDDSGWEDGNAPLGYPDTNLELDTELDYGDDPANKHITAYFRKAFTVADPGKVDSLTLRIRYDDGYVACLNGQEVARGGMPAGPITYSTEANLQNGSGGAYEQTNLVGQIGQLAAGANVLAVEIHQVAPDSSDIFLDLELVHTVTQAPTVAIPTFNPPHGTEFMGSTNVTISTATSGATVFYTTDGSTPDSGSANNGTASVQLALSENTTVKARAYKDDTHAPSAIAQASYTKILPTVATPTIDPAGGNFYGSVNVTISTATAGATVFYTTDGSTPGTGSANNGTGSVQFSLSDNATVKARAYKADHNASDIASATFTDPTFTAYNDVCWETGQLAQNITIYTRSQGGALIDYASGSTLGAQLSLDAGGDGPYVAQGTNAAVDTDAHDVFGGIVDCRGLISYETNDLTLSFQCLDPGLRYEVVLFGNRDKSAYADRITKTKILGADAFVNASTDGAGFSGPDDDSTQITNGYNTVDGYVSRYKDIDCGTNGQFQIRVYDDVSPAQPKFYVNAVMIRAYNATGTPVELITKGTTWRFLKGSVEASDPATGWRAEGFADVGWAEGNAPIGYGSAGPYGTELTDMQDSYASVFLRRSFQVDNPGVVQTLALDVDYDDGFIVWLNAEEIARVGVSGAPGAFVACDQPCAGYVAGGKTNWATTLQAGALPVLDTNNVLAVQLFNNTLGSSDACLDLALSITLRELDTGDDADQDGLPDDWEVAAYGGTGLYGWRADPDLDGVSMIGEYIAGTGGTNPTSFLQVDVAQAAGQLIVSFPTIPVAGPGYDSLDRHYRLETRGALNPNETWTSVPGHADILGQGQTVGYTNTSPAGAGCYRARVWLE